MSKGLGGAAVAAVLAIATGWSAPAWADHNQSAGQAGPGCSPSGTSLALTAENHKFDRNCLAVTAGESFTIRFDNRDSDRHNVAILPSHTSTDVNFAGDIIPGPKATVYAVPPLKAGTYHFHCEVHPNLMNGTFVVAAPPDTGGRAASTPGVPRHESRPAPPATPAAAEPSAAATPAPEGKPARAGKPAPSATPAPATTPPTRGANRAAAAPATASTGTDGAAPRPTPLPRTGSADRALLLLAGLALATGGLSVLAGARNRARV